MTKRKLINCVEKCRRINKMMRRTENSIRNGRCSTKVNTSIKTYACRNVPVGNTRASKNTLSSINPNIPK